MRLSNDDLRTFAADGYLVIAEVVPERLLAAADAEIDDLITSVVPDQGERGSKVLLESGGHSTLLNPPLELGAPVEPTSCSVTTKAATSLRTFVARSTPDSRSEIIRPDGSPPSSTHGPSTRRYDEQPSDH